MALLQRYNISLSESALKQLQDAPLAWTALQKKITRKCAIFALQKLHCKTQLLCGEVHV